MLRRQIAFLEEYHARLIADVVTGKLDVREVAASLPDEADEPEPLAGEDLLTDENEVDEIGFERGRSRGSRSMTTDTSEKGLEELIVRGMTGRTECSSPSTWPPRPRSRSPAAPAGFSATPATTTASTASTSCSCAAFSWPLKSRSSKRYPSTPTGRPVASSSPGCKVRSASAA